MSAHPTDELLYWMATSQLLGIAAQKMLGWFKTYGDYRSLFNAAPAALSAAGFSARDIQNIKNIQWDTLENERHWYAQHGKVICFQDPLYPPQLKEIADPPLLLYVAGNAALLSAAQIAIVGSRHPSPLGSEKASEFAAQLAATGFVITSGLALGIDKACHQGTLAVQGKTIAVLGTGLNQIYPRTHVGLANTILQHGGALVSEFPLNTAPLPWHFPRRNRIISGLSLGVLVVEAALNSGSLITARCALEQNREVFAIPGSINHPLARGCHQLIRQGAKLVETLDDILEELSALWPPGVKIATVAAAPPTKSPTGRPLDLSDQDHQLLNCVDYSATPLDAIYSRSGLTISEVSSILLILELRGYIQAVQGGYIRCGS